MIISKSISAPSKNTAILRECILKSKPVTLLQSLKHMTCRNPAGRPYLYGLRGDLEFWQRRLAVCLHFSHGAAVRLSTVAFGLWALGFRRFLAVHRPNIRCGLLQHWARFGHEGRGKGLTRVLSSGERGVDPRRGVPVGLSFSRGFGAVALLAVMLLRGQRAPQVAVAAGGAQRTLCRTRCVRLWVLRPSAVFTRLLFPHLPCVSLAATAAAATASVAPLAAESWAFLGLGRRSGCCRADGSPLITLATATATDAALVPTVQRGARFLLRGRRAVRGFSAYLWKCVTNRFFHLVVVAQHTLNAAGQLVFLAGLKREAENEVRYSTVRRWRRKNNERNRQGGKERRQSHSGQRFNTWVNCFPQNTLKRRKKIYNSRFKNTKKKKNNNPKRVQSKCTFLPTKNDSKVSLGLHLK